MITIKRKKPQEISKRRKERKKKLIGWIGCILFQGIFHISFDLNKNDKVSSLAVPSTKFDRAMRIFPRFYHQCWLFQRIGDSSKSHKQSVYHYVFDLLHLDKSFEVQRSIANLQWYIFANRNWKQYFFKRYHSNNKYKSHRC